MSTLLPVTNHQSQDEGNRSTTFRCSRPTWGRTFSTVKTVGGCVLRPTVYVVGRLFYGLSVVCDALLPESWQSPKPTLKPEATADTQRLQEQNQALQAEIARLRARPAGAPEEEEGPVRKPYQHPATLISAEVIETTCAKFGKDSLTKTEKRNLFELLIHLGLVEFDSKAETHRLVIFRGEELNEKGEDFTKRMLERWLQEQKTLLIDPYKKEGYIELTEKQLDTYLRGKSSKKSDDLAEEFGLPLRSSYKDCGMAMWRKTAFDLAKKHKMLTPKELVDMEETLLVAELKKGASALELAKKQKAEKEAWIANGGKPAAPPQNQSVAPPAPPPPPPPALTATPKKASGGRAALLGEIARGVVLRHRGEQKTQTSKV